MTLTFPLPASTFFGTLPITSFTFDLGEALEMNETGNGEILTADIGQRLWRIDCACPGLQYTEIERVKAKLDVLRYAGRSLIISAMPMKAPQNDPTGAILGLSAPVLNMVAGNNRELRIGGLPAGYVLDCGDVLSFQYGSNPVRYAYHRIIVGGAANGAGLSPLLEVAPFIQPGYSLGAAVKLIKAELKAVYVPGSFNAGSSAQGWTNGVKFSFVQTLR